MDGSEPMEAPMTLAERLQQPDVTQGEYDATIRMSDAGVYARVQTGMAALVSAGILTAATRAAVLALADAPRSWAEANGIEVSARTVGIARGAKA
jgi:hypothetical protein